MHDIDSLANDAFMIFLIVFIVLAARSFDYVKDRYPNYWRERRTAFVPSVDLLYNSYLLLRFLVRRDYKALGDQALDKRADNARLCLILLLIVGLLIQFH
jgi:hypothetical protein